MPSRSADPPGWPGIQMDEAGWPILLAGTLRRLDAPGGLNPWPMVRHGPVIPQDRWEEDGGYSPFTLAVEGAALLDAAAFAAKAGDARAAECFRQTADVWNSKIEAWIYVMDTELARQVGVEGYYVRTAPPEIAGAASPNDGDVPIKNRPPDQSLAPSAPIVSPDALARFGLRAADDPRILNTVRAIDAILKTETAAGPVWHRYNHDGYGEHDDGAAFDGRVFDTPTLTVQRYQAEKVTSPFAIWRFNHKCRCLAPGHVLRVEVLAPAVVRWSLDEWRTTQDTVTFDAGLGVFLAELPTAALPPGTRLRFTFFWREAQRWEGTDFAVTVRAES
jgi:hypothetical protein